MRTQIQELALDNAETNAAVSTLPVVIHMDLIGFDHAVFHLVYVLSMVRCIEFRILVVAF